MAELGEIARAEVGQFVMLPITPNILDRIEFRGVARQPLDGQPTALRGDEVADHPRPVRRQPSHTTNSLPERWRNRWPRNSTTWGARMLVG